MITKNKRYSLLGYPGPRGDDGAGVAVQAGTVLITNSTINFQNSNSITFGLATNGIMTASFSQETVAGGGGNWVTATKTGSDIQISTGNTNTLHYGNFITTYVAGGDGNALGLNTAITGGSMTGNTSGLTISLPNYLTTAAESVHTHDYQSTGPYLTTAQPVGNYLTTAALSNHTHSDLYQSTGAYLTTAAQSIHTHDYQSTGAYLTTAMQSNSSSVFAKTGFTSSSQAGATLSATNNTNGLSMLVPSWLTTAAQSVHTHLLSEVTSINTDINLAFGGYGINFQFPNSVSTNATRAGAFEIDAQGAFQGDLVHIHQHVGNPNATFDLLHLEAEASAGTGLRLEFTHTNQLPLIIDGGSRGASISLVAQGVPLILNQSASNSVQWLNANYLQGKVSSEFQSTGNYLTTAMQSASSSVFAKTGFTSSSITGTNIKGTLDTNGLSMMVPNYLTVAAGAGDGVNIIAAGGSTAASTGTYVFSNSNGISFSLNGSTITAQHNAYTGTTSGWLTTAAASNHTHGSAPSITGSIGVTSNSSAWSISIPAFLTTAQPAGAYLTTAAQSNQVVNSFNGSTGQISLVTGSGMSTTTNASTLTFGLRSDISTAWSGQTTANQSRVVQINGLSNSLSFATASSLSSSINGSTISWGLASNITTALQSAGAYLTTAMASANTSLYMSTSERANYFYTSNNTFANNTHVHGNPTLALTNLSGTTASASNGVTISLSAANPGAGGGIAASIGGNSTSAGGGYSNITSGTMILAGGNNITLSQNGSVITISAATALGPASVYFSDNDKATWSSSVDGSSTTIMITSLGVAGGGVAVIASNATYTSGSISFRGTNITIGTSAGGQYVDLSVGVGGGGVAVAGSGASTVTNGTLQFANSNGVSFGLDGSTMTASYNSTQFAGLGTSTATTSATALAVSMGSAGIALTYPAVGYLSLVNSNGYTWSTSTNGVSTAIWLVLGHTA